MSPSWLKSLRGSHHTRTRSESTSSSTSESGASSIRSAFSTRRSNNSREELDKENTQPAGQYDPTVTPFKGSNNRQTRTALHQQQSQSATLYEHQQWNSPTPSLSNTSTDSEPFQDSALLGSPSPSQDSQKDPFDDALLSPSTAGGSPCPSPPVAEFSTNSPVISSGSNSSTSSIVSPAMSRQSSQTTASSASDGPIDIDVCIQKLIKDGYTGTFNKRPALTNNEIMTICSLAREVVMQQPMLLEIDPSVKIVGDIHGQYHDLLRMFNMCGFPPQANYLFLGDYVDRGAKGLECILLLLCYKIKHPENFFILRGNHEAAAVTRVYGFFDECRRRTGQVKIWKSFIDTFNCLPIAAIVAGKIFCVHGGLSPHLLKMDQIRQLQRPAEVSECGLLNDLLWSDPSDTAVHWEPNERGVSWAFSKEVLAAFLEKHDLDLVCRAHMVVEDGYEFWADRKLLTVFSAPNYVSQFDNMGAVLSVDDQLVCSFNLLKPLDGVELKREMLRAQQRFSIEQAKSIKDSTKSRKKFRL